MPHALPARAAGRLRDLTTGLCRSGRSPRPGPHRSLRCRVRRSSRRGGPQARPRRASPSAAPPIRPATRTRGSSASTRGGCWRWRWRAGRPATRRAHCSTARNRATRHCRRRRAAVPRTAVRSCGQGGRWRRPMLLAGAECRTMRPSTVPARRSAVRETTRRRRARLGSRETARRRRRAAPQAPTPGRQPRLARPQPRAAPATRAGPRRQGSRAGCTRRRPRRLSWPAPLRCPLLPRRTCRAAPAAPAMQPARAAARQCPPRRPRCRPAQRPAARPPLPGRCCLRRTSARPASPEGNPPRARRRPGRTRGSAATQTARRARAACGRRPRGWWRRSRRASAWRPASWARASASR